MRKRMDVEKMKIYKNRNMYFSSRKNKKVKSIGQNFKTYIEMIATYYTASDG